MSARGSPFLDPRDLVAAWLERLPRTPGGYAETLGPDWAEVGAGERTMLCQSRLAYVFVHAGLLGDSRSAAEGVAAIDAIQRHFWRPEARGWLRAIDAGGRPIDDRIESYDQAFGLLALAWAYRATGDGALRAKALEALAGLDAAALADGISSALDYEGFPEWRRAAPSRNPASIRQPSPRRQNPHMHLLEAFLAWHAADPEGPWLQRAASIVHLAKRRFIQADGSLCEHFDETLEPAPGGAGRQREPGHHFEWVWLLRRWEEASGDKGALEAAATLYRLACDRGRDADGLAFDLVEPDGKVIADTKLLWPQTEMIKAHAAWFEWTGDAEAKSAALASLDILGKSYMRPDGKLYYNQLGRDRTPLPVATLSRVLYHLFLALVEAKRVFALPSA